MWLKYLGLIIALGAPVFTGLAVAKHSGMLEGLAAVFLVIVFSPVKLTYK